MSANHDLERRIADFYATETPSRAPDWVLESALATIATTQQRRAFIRGPWRISSMNMYAKVAIAAVAVVAVGAIGLAVMRPGSGPGVGGASPSSSPSSSPSPSASPSPSSSSPALTETFSSTMHGISISYPAGWNLQPATESWTSGIVQQDSPFADVIYEKESDSPLIAVASQLLSGRTADRWATDYLAQLTCVPTEPVTVDGASGVLATCEDGPHALVSVEGRGYLIWLYRIDDPDWFQEILGTVQLSPGDALDAAPSASPSGS